jgi:hypothetical protein
MQIIWFSGSKLANGAWFRLRVAVQATAPMSYACLLSLAVGVEAHALSFLLKEFPLEQDGTLLSALPLLHVLFRTSTRTSPQPPCLLPVVRHSVYHLYHTSTTRGTVLYSEFQIILFRSCEANNPSARS